MPTSIETLASYLPASILRKAAEDIEQFNQPMSDTFQAAVLFADISGFTALTERLASRGGAGAEDLTRLLNAYLGQLVSIVLDHGGDIVKFAGDAVLALWPRTSDAVSLSDVIQRTAECSLEIQAKLHDHPVAEDVRLSLKLAISAGTVVTATLGGVFKRWEYLVAGTPLAQVGEANARANPGQIVLTPQTWIAAEGRCVGREIADGFVLLESVPTALPRRRTKKLVPPPGAEAILRSFIPAAIRTRLDAGQSDWLAELRRLTVLFVNLPDLNHRTPLEHAQQAMQMLQTNLYRYEGSINKLSVDDKGASLIAVMGLPPLAHEDDPARGVRAAMAMQEGLQSLGLRSAIGVTTGLVFCGSVGGEIRREYTIMGDVVNLAARLMQAAPGSILCDETTWHAARPRIAFTAIEPIKVKGKKDPIPVYCPSARDTAAPGVMPGDREQRSKTEMVGREHERELIGSRIESLIKERRPGRIIIEGDAGIGKSRLIEFLLVKAVETGARVLAGAADSIESSTPYFAWRRVFVDLFGLESLPSDPAVRQSHILRLLPPDPNVKQIAPLLGVVLPFDWPDNDFTAQLVGKERADFTHRLLIGLLQAATVRRPIVLVIEDAHWLDSGSFVLLQLAAERLHSLLLVVATRPMPDPPPAEYEWLRSAAGTDVLELGRLDPDATVAISCRSLGVDSLPGPVAEIIREKAEGNPFFAEELSYALRDAGFISVVGRECRISPDHGSTMDWTLPDTVQGVITSRIDRLTPAQQLTIKVASVIGRIFSLRTLRDIHPIPADREHIPEHFRVLHQLDLTPLEKPAPDLEYIFKHIITHEVAYNLMPYSQRRKLHQAVAEWYESQYASDLEPHYPYLAWHWRRAAEDRVPDAEAMAKAIEYLKRAGDLAVRRFLNVEAIGFYTEGLELVGMLPESPDRDRVELGLQLALGAVLIATRGYAAGEVQTAYARAQQLCGVADDDLRFAALRGLWAYCIGRASFHQARELGDQMLVLANKSEEPSLLMEAHRALGNAVFWIGEFNLARTHMERAIGLYSADRDRSLAFLFGQDPDVANRGMQTWPLSLVGYPEQALASGAEALAHARDLGHPYSLGYALIHDMCCRQYLHDVSGVIERAEEAIALAQDKGFPNWLLAGMAVHGWAQVMRGRVDAGLAELDQAITLWRGSGAELVLPYLLALQAEARMETRSFEKALAIIRDAIHVSRKNDDRWFAPELHRLEGEILEKLGRGVSDVETRYQWALNEARALNARLIELRVAVSLGRLWMKVGRRTEARDLVASIYNAFTEGWETYDLVQAREFLKVVAGEASTSV